MGAPDRPRPLEDPPDWVQYTVVSSPSPRPPRARPSLVRAALATAVLGAAVAAAGPGPGTGHAAAVPRDAGVFRYPLGCLGAAVSGGRVAARPPPIPDPCFHYGVYVTAVLRRSGDIWRLGLEAVSPSCPAVSLPREVRANLIRCERRSQLMGGL